MRRHENKIEIAVSNGDGSTEALLFVLDVWAVCVDVNENELWIQLVALFSFSSYVFWEFWDVKEKIKKGSEVGTQGVVIEFSSTTREGAVIQDSGDAAW